MFNLNDILIKSLNHSGNTSNSNCFPQLESPIYVNHFQNFAFECRSGVDKQRACGTMKRRRNK